ncbi:MAG: hypothetical protein P4L92_20260 [Rudaea sp.]|nr:hypothetical protein [Rudaea sp.]
MLKVAVIACLGFGFILCASNAAAAEMAMPAGAAFAPAASSGDVETASTATRSQAGATGAMRESGSRSDDSDVTTTATRVRMQPDSVAATRTDTTHAAVGTDAAAGTVVPVHKARHSAHWQSLLPGVMK